MNHHTDTSKDYFTRYGLAVQEIERLRIEFSKCAEHLHMLQAHLDHKPERFRAYCWSKVVAANAALGCSTPEQQELGK